MDTRAAARTAAALAAAARAGPFFVLEPWTPAGPWRPLAELISEPALSGQVSRARSVLAERAGIAPSAVEARVAASVVCGGALSRLISPLLGAAVMGGLVPGLTPADLWWRPGEEGRQRLAAGPAGGTEVGDLATREQVRFAADFLAERAEAVTSPVTTAFAAAFRVSPRVLRGNAASALAGAAAMLGRGDPACADAAYRLAAEILTRDPLRGTGEFVAAGPGGTRRQFVRRSCCLIYRIPGSGTCGDCVLTSRSR